jgi:hypothetical protein
MRADKIRIKEALKYMLIVFMISISTNSKATVYYVDSGKGNDSGNGTTLSSAWKSIAKVNSQKFIPGDKVCFMRGSEWIGELIINSSGTKLQPIVFTAYGNGPNPVIKNPGVKGAVSIKINSDWVIVENFLVKESHMAGIDINKGAKYNIVRNNEATKSGMGVAVHGDHNLVTRNYAHDLTMVVNDPGGDNDYGAVGIWLFSSNNEVSYNKLINCKAPSLDYGFDGGVVEFYGNVDSCYVHHNWGENCDGAFEVGGQGDTLTHNLIAYNVYLNNGFAGGFHVGGKFGVHFVDMRVENNVFIDTTHNDYAIGFWNGNNDLKDFTYRNNIFYIPNYQRVSNMEGFIHNNNLFWLGGKTDIGIKPGAGDKIGDPLFQNFKMKDFHLRAGSPAIDAGLNLDYSIDYDGNKVPQGSEPDMGAYEFKPDSQKPAVKRK